MKRWIIAIFLVIASSALAGSIYSWLREPAAPPERCTMDWLADELALTDVQYTKIWALHSKLCPQISRLDRVCSAVGGERPACERMTSQLIEEVSAQLSPTQRDKYLRIVESCRGQTEASSP